MGKAGSALACVCFLLGSGPAAAQGWPPWADDSFGRRPWGYERRPSWDGYEPLQPRERRALTPKGGDIRDGGARPEIAPQAPAVVTFPDDLSEREVEVLQYVATGLSNREIGGRLFISQNTVANHVRAILRKTGCANRTEAAGYAMRHNLLRW